MKRILLGAVLWCGGIHACFAADSFIAAQEFASAYQQELIAQAQERTLAHLQTEQDLFKPSSQAVSSSNPSPGLTANTCSPTLPYIPSKIRLAAGLSTESRGIFYLDYLLPLYYPALDGTTLVYFNPKQTWQSPYADELNLGLGIRQAFEDWFILGAHVFYDKKYTARDIWHHQVGYGLEFLSQPFDARYNYYNPLNKPRLVGDATYSFGSTSLLRYDQYEEPLCGSDFEIGVPLIPKFLNTRFYAGGFFYESKLAKDRNGFRLRTETAFKRWLSLDTTYNQDSSGEGELIGQLRFTVPFELEYLAEKANPFVNTFKVNTYLQDRIFERVVRDIDIQASSVTKREDVAGIDMIYVDNSKPAGGDGSLEHPYNTLAQALASGRYAAGKYVYVFAGDGTNTGYDSALGYDLVYDDVVLWGSKYNGGYKGLPVTTGYPMIGGKLGATIANPIITLANNNTVMGLDIEYSTTYGIYGLNKNAANILHNNIANNSVHGVYLEFTDAADYSGFTFTDNTITGNGIDGIYVRNDVGTISDFTFTGNTITGNSFDGIDVSNYGAGTISDFTFTGNTITGNSWNGISVWNFIAGTIDGFTFTGNTITGSTYFGIGVGNMGTGTISDFTFTGNTITGNDWHGIAVWNYGTGGTVSDFTFTGNTVTGNIKCGIYVANVYDATGTISDFTFIGNTITGNTWDGIQFEKNNGSMSSINLGNGTLGGNNSIYDNNVALGAYFDIKNNSGIDLLLAQYNWWGQAGGPIAGQIGGGNTVDHTHPLPSPP